MPASLREEIEIEFLRLSAETIDISWNGRRFWGHVTHGPFISVDAEVPKTVLEELATLNAEFIGRQPELWNQASKLSLETRGWAEQHQAELVEAVKAVINHLRAAGGQTSLGGFKRKDASAVTKLRLTDAHLASALKVRSELGEVAGADHLDLAIPQVDQSRSQRVNPSRFSVDAEAAKSAESTLRSGVVVPRAFSLVSIAESLAARGSLDMATTLLTIACEVYLKELVIRSGNRLAADLVLNAPSPQLSKLYRTCIDHLNLPDSGLSNSTLNDLAQARNAGVHSPNGPSVSATEFAKHLATTRSVLQSGWTVLAD